VFRRRGLGWHGGKEKHTMQSIEMQLVRTWKRNVSVKEKQRRGRLSVKEGKGSQLKGGDGNPATRVVNNKT